MSYLPPLYIFCLYNFASRDGTTQFAPACYITKTRLNMAKTYKLFFIFYRRLHIKIPYTARIVILRCFCGFLLFQAVLTFCYQFLQVLNRALMYNERKTESDT